MNLTDISLNKSVMTVDDEMIRNMYINILHKSSVHCVIPIKLEIKDLIVLNHWNVEPKIFVDIAGKYCPLPKINFD